MKTANTNPDVLERVKTSIINADFTEYFECKKVQPWIIMNLSFSVDELKEIAKNCIINNTIYVCYLFSPGTTFNDHEKMRRERRLLEEIGYIPELNKSTNRFIYEELLKKNLERALDFQDVFLFGEYCPINPETVLLIFEQIKDSYISWGFRKVNEKFLEDSGGRLLARIKENGEECKFNQETLADMLKENPNSSINFLRLSRGGIPLKQFFSFSVPCS